MKLRSKLKIAFLIMAFLPIMLCAVTLTIIFKVELKSMKETYGVKDNYGIEDIYSPSSILAGMTEEAYDELNRLAKENPSILRDRDYLDGISKDLSFKLSYLVVKGPQGYIYSSAPYTYTELDDLIPNARTAASLGNIGLYKGESYRCLIKAVSFKDSNGNIYGAYIVTPLSQSIPEFKRLMIEAFIIIVEALAFTSLLLYYWINKSFLKPIDRLRLGAQNIKDGNMDFDFKSTSNDEMGLLCQDFEDMRQRLQKSAEEKEKSDMEEKELIRNISHDLKTPITAIKGYVEGLIDGIANTPEKQERYIKTIANKVEDMDRLIDELTLFARLDTNRILYDFIKVNVKGYFDDCIDEIRLDLDAQDITLNYHFHCDDKMEMMADPNQLKRVINNIVSNSVKYKDLDRPLIITIGVYDEGDYIHIMMADTGKGIPAKDLPRIFDRFYRTDESRTSPQSGSGIGLAIVKKIIEDHKGRIWVESVEGEGTTFHINLLRYKEDMQLSLPDNQKKASKTSKRRKS